VVIWVQNLNHFKSWKIIPKENIFVQVKLKLPDFRRVNTDILDSGTGTHTLLMNNNFTDTLCDADD